jgi:hypothetical protein
MGVVAFLFCPGVVVVLTYQLLLPPPCFFVLDGDSPAYPALPKYFGRLASGTAVPLARPAWSRSVVLWERVTVCC